jgi:hypothetical protein
VNSWRIWHPACVPTGPGAGNGVLWNQEAIMGRSRGLTKKEMKKHAKFLAAWEAAEFPEIFVYEGKSLDTLRPIAEWYREQKQKDVALVN